MNDILTRILEAKRLEVESNRGRLPEETLRSAATAAAAGRRGFLERLSAPGPDGVNIIAEIKRGSPSKGMIRADLDPETYARAYERGGAAAMSVLTDGTFFHGSPDDLMKARAAVDLPTLRKDFIVSEYQIYESAAMGADAVLLIVRALSREFLRNCLSLCSQLGLDALVEVHSEAEMEAALEADARLIGINNRDLAVFKTDIQTSVELARRLPSGRIAVSESGIHDRAQVERLLDAGIWNFLIGESLVRAADPVAVLWALSGRPTSEDAALPGRGAAG